MKAVILAAGYGTRLYPLTLDKPKAFLEVGGKIILERVLEKIFSIKGCNEAYIVTNNRFYRFFVEWTRQTTNPAFKDKKIDILNDGTTSNDNRLGAIGDINFVLERRRIDDDIIVVGSDNVFDFDLRTFIKFARSKGEAACVALYDVADIKKASLYGIAVLKNPDGQIEDFQEKPKEPRSTLAATAIYYYPKMKVARFKEYMESGMSKDAPGNLIKWLNNTEKVFGFVFKDKWYDIGDLESLMKADKDYKGSKR